MDYFSCQDLFNSAALLSFSVSTNKHPSIHTATLHEMATRPQHLLKMQSMAEHDKAGILQNTRTFTILG